ncbi:MAG: hypothetical protein ACRELA_16205 [Candidatus Rokuibacteriota bacterium]
MIVGLAEVVLELDDEASVEGVDRAATDQAGLLEPDLVLRAQRELRREVGAVEPNGGEHGEKVPLL